LLGDNTGGRTVNTFKFVGVWISTGIPVVHIIFDRMYEYFQRQLEPNCIRAAPSGTYDPITKVGECLYILIFCSYFIENMGRHSSVGIATRYGFDGPGIESRLRRHFPHPSRPVSEPTQPPIQ